MARDRAANPRDPKAQLVLLGLRVCQHLISSKGKNNPLAKATTFAYRAITETVLGLELRPATRVGPGLAIFHGFGLVVNDGAVIGAEVKLRNGVVIGHKAAGGGCPVIGDAVDIGAGAIILGPIRIGSGARVGAGAVVTRDVSPGSTVVGNPARLVNQSGPDPA